MDYWETHKGTAVPITVDMLKAAFQKIEDRDYQVYPHVVHPKDEGWAICANCFQPVFVPETRIK